MPVCVISERLYRAFVDNAVEGLKAISISSRRAEQKNGCSGGAVWKSITGVYGSAMEPFLPFPASGRRENGGGEMKPRRWAKGDGLGGHTLRRTLGVGDLVSPSGREANANVPGIALAESTLTWRVGTALATLPTQVRQL